MVATVPDHSDHNSFAKYSERAWIKHARVLEVEKASYDSILRFLVYNGSKLQFRTAGFYGKEYAGPPLYVASAIGLIKTVERLLNEGVRADEMAGIEGFLESTAPEGSYYKKKLVEFHVPGFEEVKDGKGDYHFGSALQAACYNGHENIVRCLLSKDPPLVNAQTQDEYGTPLHTACYRLGGDDRSRKAIVETLLEAKGANVNVQGGKYGNALQRAIRSGHMDTVKLLLEKGADVNLEGGLYGTILRCAACFGHTDTVKLLLEKGANINANGGSCETPLQGAAWAGHTGTAELLLENGADVDLQGGEYGTALRAACSNGKYSMVKILLEHGADPNLSGNKPGTLLTDAAAAPSRDSKELVWMLLERGFDINALNENHQSALSLAADRRNDGVIAVLVEKGADFVGFNWAFLAWKEKITCWMWQGGVVLGLTFNV